MDKKKEDASKKKIAEVKIKNPIGNKGKGNKKGKNQNEEEKKKIYSKFGKKILNYKLEEQDLDEKTFLSGIKEIGVLFTGTWVPPAKKFLEELTKVYNYANKDTKQFEIIQISSEKTEKNYKDAITENRPWLYLPFNDPYMKDLVKEYNIKYLPYLIIINRDGYILSENGRKDMHENEPEKAFKLWKDAYNDRVKELKDENKEDEGSDDNQSYS